MKIKNLIKVMLILFMPFAAKASNIEPKSIEVYIKHGQEYQVVNTNLYNSITRLRFIDDYDLIETQINSSFDEFDPQTEEFDEYKERAIQDAKGWMNENEDFTKNAISNIKSALANNLRSIPAIIIDNEYISYGVTLSESIKEWKNQVLKRKR